MTASPARTLLTHLHRLPRWIRPALAGLCLLLAAASALSARAETPARPAPTTADATVPSPEEGDVVVAVTLADGGAAGTFLRPGQRIELFGAAGAQASDGPARVTRVQDVLILAVGPSAGEKAPGIGASGVGETAQGTRLVVSVNAEDVAQIASLEGASKFAAVDK